jgi:AcrR family transcriptional regulator
LARLGFEVNRRWHITGAMPPAETPARRSDETRARILRAARDRFAAEGYDRTTIRSVARDAAIDPSMVMRYFGSKEGLFAAAASFDLGLPDLGAVPRGTLGPALVRHFLARWEGDPSDDALRVLLRAAASRDSAAERMREIFRTQLVPAVAAVAPRPQAAERAGLVATQMLGLAFCRYVLRLPGVADLSHDAVAARIGPTIQRYLTGR